MVSRFSGSSLGVLVLVSLATSGVCIPKRPENIPMPSELESQEAGDQMSAPLKNQFRSVSFV